MSVFNSVTDNNNLLKPFNKGVSTENILTSSINNFNDPYDVTPAAQAKGTVRIPVLTYHHVAPVVDKPGIKDYYVSPEMFDQQMAYLEDHNYKTLTPQEFYDQVASGKNPTQKSVLLTFDDGNYDNYEYAYPILVKYGFTGTFYVPSNRRAINNAQLKEMSNAGMIIDPHGKTHMLLSHITDPAILATEIGDSKTIIQAITGVKVVSFCYPGCEYNSTVIHTLASDGYLLAFSCGTSIDHKLSYRYALSRMHVYNDMRHFKSILSGVSYYPY
jgi:peptidoglycan/xylan/chitin deacetylase (PgdA/CDA1 family)